MEKTYKRSLNSATLQTQYKDHLYALIICGGAGTRLWPRSRQKTPKQFLEKFYGEKTLFTQTVERAKLLTTSDKIWIVTLTDYVDEILAQSPDILPKNIIAEPFGKNTAMAIGIGATYIKKINPSAVIMNFWSDAVIEQNDIFTERLNLAAQAASAGDNLIVIGLKPTFPHTGLGYVEAGEVCSEFGKDIFKVNSFREKPDLVTASEFLAKGNFFWNTGIYVWSVKAILAAFAKYSPEISKLLEKIYNGIGSAQERDIVKQVYTEVENVSVDLAVSEQADNLLLVPANFGWSDIGDWQVAYDLKKKDEGGNVIEVFGKEGWHLGVETKNCLLEVQDRLIATIGVSDLVIVETEDAVLICDRKKAQEVKKIVNLLKEKGKTQYL